MAGHPLRPATRRSLGRPLPHQQADRPRAHPWPKKLSTTSPCRRSSYPVLATVSGSYPKAKGRLLTCYSPVRRSSTPERAFPLDLHVLSTPPAFVLSQDQTLRERYFLQRAVMPGKLQIAGYTYSATGMTGKSDHPARWRTEWIGLKHPHEHECPRGARCSVFKDRCAICGGTRRSLRTG